MNEARLERNHGRARAIRWSIYGGVPGLILLVYFLAWAWPLNPVPIEVSRETTYLTEPVREDGSIDYVAAINARGENIPHEDNAAALLVRIADPDGFRLSGGIQIQDAEPEQLARLQDWFDLAGPPSPDEQFLTWREYHRNLSSDDQSTDGDDLAKRLLSEPWNAEAYPQVVAWLERNAPMLELVKRASRRPKFFWPAVPDETETLASAPLLPPATTRSAPEALLVRAQMRIAEGSPRAKDDIAAVVRVSSLLRGDGGLISNLIGGALSEASVEVVDDWLASQPPSGEIRELLTTFRMLPGTRSHTTWLTHERFVLLDVIQSVHTERLTDLTRFGIDRSDYGDFDVNRVLRRANDWCDRFLEPGGPAAFADFKGAQYAAMHGWRAKVLGVVGPAPVRRSVRTDAAMELLVRLMPPLSRVRDLLNDYDARLIVTKMALAVAAYRAEQGAYPATLEKLVPEYLDAVPDDPYGEGALGYARVGDDGAKVWSIGPDGVDQGGVDDRPADEQRRDAPHDIVFELGPPGAE